MDSIGCNCQKKLTTEEEYGVHESEESIPKSLVDIKINTTKLIKKRTQKVIDFYEIERQLGSGAFGDVFLVRRKGGDNTSIERALKVIEKANIIANDGNEDEIRNEINVLRQLDHPNIMKIYEFFEDEKSINLICEFCDSGDLADKMDKYGVFPEFLVKYVMYQVFMGVSFLHENKVFHGDLKRENIAFVSMSDDKEGKVLKQIMENKEVHDELLSASGHINLSDEALEYCKELANYELKILDFGSAVKVKKANPGKKLSGVIGTTYYCSPEVVNDEYDFDSDEWACGVMMYILLSGRPPFTGNTEKEVFDNILNKEPNFDIPQFKDVTQPCLDLIAKLLQKDPSKRIKAAQALKTEFFKTGINIGNLLKGKWKENAKLLFRLATIRSSQIEKKVSKFKETVIAYICMNFTDKKQEKIVKQVFRELSEDNKKYLITKKSFISHMKKCCKDFSEKELGELFDSLDNDLSGNIEYEELMRALSDKEKLLSEKNLKEAFRFFDQDNSGTITWNEIAEIIFISGDIPQNIVTEFLDEIGQKDENMAITFEEFQRIIKG